jgi:hypothetical protein
MLNKVFLLMLLMFFGLWGCSQSVLPTTDEVDSLIEQYKSETDKGQKTLLLKNLLARLSNPKNVSDDNIVKNTLKKLADIYNQNHDEAILIAVDETPIDGGFANFICSFYRSLKAQEQFKERYRQSPKALERCIGISFDETEIKKF